MAKSNLAGPSRSVHRRRRSNRLYFFPERHGRSAPIWSITASWFACVGKGTDMPLFSEIPDAPRRPSRYVHAR